MKTRIPRINCLGLRKSVVTSFGQRKTHRRYVVALGDNGFWWITGQDMSGEGAERKYYSWVQRRRHLTKRAAWGDARRLALKYRGEAMLVEYP